MFQQNPNHSFFHVFNPRPIIVSFQLSPFCIITNYSHCILSLDDDWWYLETTISPRQSSQTNIMRLNLFANILPGSKFRHALRLFLTQLSKYYWSIKQNCTLNFMMEIIKYHWSFKSSSATIFVNSPQSSLSLSHLWGHVTSAHLPHGIPSHIVWRKLETQYLLCVSSIFQDQDSQSVAKYTQSLKCGLWA